MFQEFTSKHYKESFNQVTSQSQFSNFAYDEYQNELNRIGKNNRKQARENTEARILLWLNEMKTDDAITLNHLCNCRMSYLYFTRLGMYN